MNKEKYKRLLRLRQSQELLLFTMIKAGKKAELTPRKVIKTIGINHKRAWYILDKWTRKGIYNYGVSLDMGWLEQEELLFQKV